MRPSGDQGTFLTKELRQIYTRFDEIPLYSLLGSFHELSSLPPFLRAVGRCVSREKNRQKRKSIRLLRALASRLSIARKGSHLAYTARKNHACSLLRPADARAVPSSGVVSCGGIQAIARHCRATLRFHASVQRAEGILRGQNRRFGAARRCRRAHRLWDGAGLG